MSIAALLQAAEYLERRERGEFAASHRLVPVNLSLSSSSTSSSSSTFSSSFLPSFPPSFFPSSLLEWSRKLTEKENSPKVINEINRRLEIVLAGAAIKYQ